MKSAKLSAEQQKDFCSATNSLHADRGKKHKEQAYSDPIKAIDEPSHHKIKWRL